MKKYYGYFVYNNKEYVIRFKIDGSLKWSAKDRCFIDDQWYVRSVDDVICMVAFHTSPMNLKAFSYALLLTHQTFINERARGVKRWKPEQEILIWR